MNQQWNGIAGQHRPDLIRNHLARSVRQSQTEVRLHFHEQQQDVLSADLGGGRPMSVVVRNGDGVRPRPCGTPRPPCWANAVSPQMGSDESDQSFRGPSRKVFLNRHRCSNPKLFWEGGGRDDPSNDKWVSGQRRNRQVFDCRIRQNNG